MSSPLASLSKIRKVPLQPESVNPGRRGIRIYGDEDEVDMLNEGHGSKEKLSVPSCYGCTGAPVAKQGSAPGPGPRDFAHVSGSTFHDSELMTSMAKKLQDLEQQVKAQSDEMLSKDQKILALEDLVQTLQQQHHGEATGQRQQELETMCSQLQRQVWEMERFLSDYGLQWVGEPMDQEDSEDKTVPEDNRDWMLARKFWKPGDSFLPSEVDFDRLLASLQDLSELAAEGDTQVTPVPGGARLRVLEPIPLTLYRNGMMLFDGPFRPFSDPDTQRCLRDILDGFFPSELQRLYPNGVPFKVSDLRHQIYPEDGLGPFPGEGRVVGLQKIRKASDRAEEHPGSRMTAEEFLNRLPKCVIRQGEVIDIRGPMRDTLQNCCPLPAPIQETIVETPALAAERQRSQEYPGTPAPPLSMLRVKSEDGEQAFLLMMRPEDTIGNVRILLAQARAADAATFEIFSTFPPTVYRDDSVSLQAAGLVPNATLLLRACRALLSNRNFGSSSGSGPGLE